MLKFAACLTFFQAQTNIGGRKEVLYMKYASSIDYINSFAWLGSRLGLSRIKELLARMGRPDKGLSFVHLAGTNGKGSTACFLASILQAAGCKTGLYTSPYIHSFHERMQINGVSITDLALDEVVDEMRLQAEAMDDHPTTFELATAAAISWFSRENCDIVVLETGMGGSLDATNAIEAPLVSVITPIDLDHMEYLGPTIGEIARNKAGIIKKGRPVVTAWQKPEARAVLEEVAKEQGAVLREVNLDRIVRGAFDFTGQVFSFGDLNDLKIRLLGRYQVENAALALEAINILEEQGYAIPESAKREGLANAHWPGRFELVAEQPAIIVDGGHNAQGAVAFGDNLARYFPGKKAVIMMGALADKDLDALLAPVLPLAKCVYTITPDNPRAMEAEALAAAIMQRGVSAVAAKDIPAALEMGKEAAGREGVVCYFGSLYSVGAVREALGFSASGFFETALKNNF